MKWPWWTIAAAMLLALVLGVIAVGTLGGWLRVAPAEAAKRKEEREKDEQKKKLSEYVIDAPVVQPAETDSPLSFAKPGHWSTASQKMTANVRDLIGNSRLAVTNNQNAPYPLANTPFVLRASRPVLLNKGQVKSIETLFLVPQTDQEMRLATSLEERGLSLPLARLATPLTVMPSYQYHFVVLARQPSRYAYVKSLDSVKAPYDGESSTDPSAPMMSEFELSLDDPLHYRVVLVDATKPIPLSDHPLTWTSIAYILWDEVDPGDPLSAEQERALVDWLHWGGQLIISGPDSLDLLAGSFLEPFLPATSGGPQQIASDHPALAELNKSVVEGGWLVGRTEQGAEPLRPTAAWSAIKLLPRETAREVAGTGGLFVERQIGRGRIVVSAVRLAERELINWRAGFLNLFNGGLLRRPGREYRPGAYGDVTLTWADGALKDRRLDARLNCQLHYASRDLGVETSYRYENAPADASAGSPLGQPNLAAQPQMMRTYRPSEAIGGIGAWNDFSLMANAARQALREAAGVEVPGSEFVILCLAAYLMALVPLNWLVFHTLGRVEWAWIAAPIIAVIGTVVIVERARLDIGFVRAQTEIDLLEMQPAYPRAHLARYTALYTSLSTTYTLEYDNPTSVAAPFPTGGNYQLLGGQAYQNVDFQRFDKVRLAGLPISSNSTGMVHGEQMVTLEGAIAVEPSKATGARQIVNHTKLELSSVCVVRRPTKEESQRRPNPRVFEGMWIGRLQPGESVALPDRMSSISEPAFVDRRTEEARLRGEEQLNLEPMFRLALDPRYMEEGETRLVARVDEVLPGQTITPSASQMRGATLVMVHLEYRALSAPQRDTNTRRDVAPHTKEPDEDQSEFDAEVMIE